LNVSMAVFHSLTRNLMLTRCSVFFIKRDGGKLQKSSIKLLLDTTST
jgi:hypothetical protein